MSGGAGDGTVSVTDAGSLTLSNSTNVTGTGAGTVSITVNGASSTFTFGSGIALANAGLTTINVTGATSLATDTASSPVSLFGPLNVTAATITLNNNTSNSIGKITLSSAGSIAYTEGGTVNIGTITQSGTAGTLAVTSVTGNIVEAVGGGGVIVPAGYTSATFSAPAGAVTLDLAAGNTFDKTVPVAITAGNGNVTLINNAGVLLGNVSAPAGTFSVSTLASTGSIAQATGTSIFEYGAATFNTKGTGTTGKLTLANSGNNFGAITVNTVNGGTGGNVSIREAGTNNYASVTAGTGTFAAVDDLANIIETGNTGFVSVGTSSFTATAGSITLGATGNAFGGNAIQLVTATGTGSASVTDSSTTTVVATGTNIGGNLTVTNTANNGVIRDSGSSSTITVTGNLNLLALVTNSGGGASTGDIQFTGSNSTFGAVYLTAGNSASQLLDNASMVILPSTHLAGNSTLTSSGNISTTGTGGSNFGGTLSLIASGSIIISNPMNVTGQLTVDALAGPTNLSFLSKTANLNGNTPANAGNATNYTGPSP
jgi:hypothetical protein